MLVIGKVRWFNNDKGFVCIEYNGEDYFVHFSDINKKGYKSLSAGDLVTFEPAVRHQGRVAANVSLRAPERV